MGDSNRESGKTEQPQGFNPWIRWLLKGPCLSAAVLGIRDERGKVAPEESASRLSSRPHKRLAHRG
jgi:hypothetical protein